MEELWASGEPARERSALSTRTKQKGRYKRPPASPGHDAHGSHGPRLGTTEQMGRACILAETRTPGVSDHLIATGSPPSVW